MKRHRSRCDRALSEAMAPCSRENADLKIQNEALTRENERLRKENHNLRYEMRLVSHVYTRLDELSQESFRVDNDRRVVLNALRMSTEAMQRMNEYQPEHEPSPAPA